MGRTAAPVSAGRRITLSEACERVEQTLQDAEERRRCAAEAEAPVEATEMEQLRSALHCSLGYWAAHYLALGLPSGRILRAARGEEGDDFRWCLTLLDPLKEPP